MAGRHIEIRGTVQGVGFRPWVYRLAVEQGLYGEVKNDAAGVTIDAWGSDRDLDAFCHRLASPPAAAEIRTLDVLPLTGDDTGPPRGDAAFRIVPSRGDGEHRLSIPPDLATCDDCLRELFDPSDRRYLYPFVNCTHCGPRFTIATGVPYDRPVTTMAGFALCADCRREYEDPADRRFHAQPNACPVCGPHLWLEAPLRHDHRPRAVGREALQAAARALRLGEIVAIKGLGGFHLACRADLAAAVNRLRRRKHRHAKPFAVMVTDMEMARRLARVDDLAAAWLQRPERPILLLPIRHGAVDALGGVAYSHPLASGVAPGLDLVGLFLPYTPLHHLLLRAADGPLVMTSGNLAEEPIVHLDDVARERLADLTDHLLFHDRPIARPCDDSVVRVVAGVPTVLRRSRGFVPRPIRVPRSFDRPILACGAQLQNTFCVGVGEHAWFGPHVGDLDSPEAADFLALAVDEMLGLLKVRPAAVAHDLHPDLWSTRFARQVAEAWGVPTVPVQHHHAHVLAAAADAGHDGPVLGIAFDGTGLGRPRLGETATGEASAWGGEVLWVDGARCQRLATLRPLPLLGGEAAIREPWRLALALLDDAFHGHGGPPLARLPLFHRHGDDQVRILRRLARRDRGVTLAHGAGRYFDAVAAILTGHDRAAYEGHLALVLESLAGCGDAATPHSVHGLAASLEPWPFRIRTRAGQPPDCEPFEIDLRATVRQMVRDFMAGAPRGHLARRFHRTLAAATAEAVRKLVMSGNIPETAVAGGAPRMRLPVALTGGCFQNDRLTADLETELERTLRDAPYRLQILRHAAVPPGDGGLALGQALAADALLRDAATAWNPPKEVRTCV